jgi:BON domain
VAGEHPSHLKRVNVDAYDGTIYLSGFVERPIEKSDAEIAARRTEGVKQVVNDIVVRSSEDKDGRVVATIHTVSAQDLVESDIRNLPTDGRLINHVSVYALVNRGVVPGPRYRVVLWHVREAAAAALLR